MFEFNLFSAVRACRAAIPLMIERRGGAIVNVSSGMARQASPINVDYAAAKAALINLTKARRRSSRRNASGSTGSAPAQRGQRGGPKRRRGRRHRGPGRH
jgi:NAD(P)-dependent dehydrogenase (short-subunit alcohol dehydrogenase family)